MSQPDKDPEWLPPEAQNLSTQEKRFLNALKQKKAEIQDIPNPDEIENNDSFARLYIEAENAKTRRLQEQNRTTPLPVEPTEPHHYEQTKTESDSTAKIQKAQGSIIPSYNTRPQPPQSVKEEGSVVVAKKLAGNLGTAPEISAQMRIDERKFAVLDDLTLAALSHFSYRHTYDGVRYWGHITEWWLTGSQGIGGLGRRHVLQALANSSGVQSVDKAKQPNVLARNIWDRNWKGKAESEGKVVDE